MALKPLFSDGGIGVGNITVIYSNADIIANSITANANLSVVGVTNLGSVSNVKITGGTSGYYLQTDGTGNLTWAAGGGGGGGSSISNGTSNVNIATSGGNVTVGVGGTANVLNISTSNVNVAGTLNATTAIIRNNQNVPVYFYQSNTAPSTPLNGDQWYDTYSGILFEYLNDGTSAQWVDIGSLPYPNISTSNSTGILTNLATSGTAYVPFVSSTANGFYSLISNAAYTANIGNGSLNATLLGGTLTTSSQPNITSTGTLTTLSVSGNANVGNLGTSGLITATGNIRGGNLVTPGVLSVTGNANVGNLGATGVFATTLSATGNANVGNLGTTGVFATTLSSTGNSNIGNLGTTGVFATTLSASGNANVGNLGTGGLITATGNITGGNLVTPGVLSVTGNANVGNLGTTGVFATTLSSTGNSNVGNLGTTGVFATTLSSTGNSNVGNLGTTGVFATTLSASGNANVGNLGTGGLITATGNVRGGNLVTPGVLSVTGNANVGNLGATNIVGTLTTASQTNITAVGTLVSLSVSGNSNIGNINLTGNIIPTANVTYDLGSSTNLFRDLYLSGNSIKLGTQSITSNASGVSLSNALFTGTLTGSGNANVGNIGAAAGVFTGNVTANNITTTNKITAGNGFQISSGALTITNGNLDVTGNINVTGNLNYSNVTDLVIGDPLIYVGANNTGDTVDLGMVASYNQGTYYHTGIARNATNDTWTFFDGVVAEPTTVIDWANATYPTVKLGNLLATDTISSAGNANVGNLGTSGSITSTGNVTGANLKTLNVLITQNTVSAAGNINGGNLITSGLITATGNITGGNLVTGGSLSATGNSNVGNLGTTGVFATTLSATGNSNVGNLGATGVFATTLSTTGNANVDNLGTAGLITATGNLNAGNIITGGIVSATGNGTFGNVTATLYVGNLSGTGNSNVGNLGVTGVFATTVSATGNANVGNLRTTGLISAGSLSITGTSNLGAVGNVTITGGIANQILKTNGSGTLSWTDPTGGYYLHTQSSPSTTWTVIHNLNNQYVSVNPIDNTGNSYVGRYDFPVVNYTNANAITLTFSSAANGYCSIVGGGFNYANGPGNTTPAGLNTYVQFNDAGTLGGQPSFTFNKTTGNANVGNIGATTFVGNLSGTTSSVSGNANVGNLGATGVYATTLSATGNSTFDSGTLFVDSTNDRVGINTTSPSTRLHIVNGTPAGTPTAAPTGTNLLIDNNANNFITMRHSQDAGLYSGLVFADNNIGGYVIHGDGGSGDKVYIAGYGGVDIQYGTASNVTPSARTTIGSFTSSGLSVTGTVTATTLVETSSIALKENFRPIENPLEKILQLVGKIYDRKDGSNTNEVGLVSEEVEKVIPELVKNNAVAYTRLAVYLLESIKVLKDEIDELKTGK